MIWFFIGGWICGAVFMVLYAHWWIRKHVKRMTPDEVIKDIEQMKEDEAHE